MNEVLSKFAEFILVLIQTIAFLFVFAPTLVANAASVYYDGKCSFTLTGKIDQSTDIDLARQYESFSKQCSRASLYLDSNGGDVDAAMRVGDFIRQRNFLTMVKFDNSCASACVLIFLGGVTRFPIGKIGLHRPFSVGYSASESEAKSTYERINRQVSQYLERMNIPVNLLNIMNSVPPGEIKWLTVLDTDKLKELHISGKDPVFADQTDSAEARRLGISKQEYYLRQQKAEAICPAAYLLGENLEESRERGERLGKCYQDVMNGRQ